MTAETWKRLKTLFGKAAELPAEEREVFVEGIRREEEHLGIELGCLLEGNDAASWPLDKPLLPGFIRSPEKSSTFAPGATIMDRFKVVRLLGRGGMGEVYEAIDLELGSIALKTILPEIIASDPQALPRFRQEVLLERRIVSPYVCRIYELFVLPSQRGNQPVAFFTMELLSGRTLEERIQEDGPLHWREAEAIAMQLCKGLEAIHDKGVVHRDLKSRNIMLADRNGATQAVIMDFGLARAVSSAASSASTLSESGAYAIAGTPEFMAPEQFENGPTTRATDIYALGVVLYEAVTGIPPFSADSLLGTAVKRGKHLVAPSSILHELPRRWDEAIQRCLEFEPRERFQSAHELAEAIRARPFAVEAARRGHKSIRSHRIAFSMLSTILIILMAGVLMWLVKHRYRPPSPEARRWYEQGVSAIREGTYQKAVNALKQALAIDPGFALAHARLADAFNELDYYGDAKDEMLQASTTAAARNLPKLDREYLEAIRATVMHDFPTAVRAYAAITRSLPNERKADGYVDLGRAYEKRGDLTEGVKNYKVAAKIAPGYPAAFVRLGVLEGRQNHTKEAEKSFVTAEELYRGLSNYEGIAELQYQRGDIAAENWDLNRARALLTAAQTFGQDYDSQLEVRALCRLSGAEHAARNDGEAEKLAEKAKAEAEADGLDYWAAEARNRLASAETYTQGELEKADRDAQTVLQTANRNRWPVLAAEADIMLAIIKNREQQPVDAIRFAQSAFDYYRQAGYFTESTRALTLMIRATRDQADFKQALQLCQQGLDLEKKSGNPPVMIQLEEAVGSVYLKLEQFPEALKHFEAAEATAQKNSNRLWAYEVVQVADTLWQLGHYAEAEAKFESIPADERRDAYLESSIQMSLSEMGLSEEQCQSAKNAADRDMALDPTSALSPEVGILQALAQSCLGKRQEGLRFSLAAISAAEQGSDQLLIARAKLTRATLLSQAGNSVQAKQLAEASLQTFSTLGIQSSEWQTLALLSQISSDLGDGAGQRDYAAAAFKAISALQDEWGTSTFGSYQSRPDIKITIQRLEKLNSIGNRRNK